MNEKTLTLESPPARSTDEVQARRVRFVERVASDADVLLRFADPAPRVAVCTEISATEMLPVSNTGCNGLDLLILPFLPSAAKEEPGLRKECARWLGEGTVPGVRPAIVVKLRGGEILWRPGRAVLQCEPEQQEGLLLALVEFSFYENELRQIEDEISAGWPDLEIDKRLAYEVTPADLERNSVIGRRMDQTLERRIRHARIEPHFFLSGAPLPAAGRKLGEELCEKAQIEDRLEIVDGQLEVFEHVYEMCSQRISEFRASRQEHTLEWVIIVLLAAETLLHLAEILWTLEK